MNDIKDKIRGSLIGGAAGDALGYAVEFVYEKYIFSHYGKGGIMDYHLDSVSGKAVISDDTQMTLFTAVAMIFGVGRQRLRGVSGNPRVYANLAYQDWLVTQEYSYEEAVDSIINGYSDYPNMFISTIFNDIPELFVRRAPGTTCLSALNTRMTQRKSGEYITSFIRSKINNSKGCGGVMRVAPVGMMPWQADIDRIAMEGAECAAITHSHSLGYMPAAVLTQIIYRIIYNDSQMTLKQIVEEARDTAERLFAGDVHISELTDCINDAIEFSENHDSDLINIHRLGEGWVAEEALAIAIYCALKYQYDFSKGIIAAVNHNGDSDSTGAITGNILGAWVGFDKIEDKWKENLELFDTILKVADLIIENCAK